jgi:hypothetical protein
MYDAMGNTVGHRPCPPFIQWLASCEPGLFSGNATIAHCETAESSGGQWSLPNVLVGQKRGHDTGRVGLGMQVV